MLQRRTLFSAGGAASIAVLTRRSANAQPPWQAAQRFQMTIVVAFSPGGSTDVAARLVARKLADFDINAVVLNRSGGSGVEGTRWASRQPPDGRTLLAGTPPAFLFLAAREDLGFTWRDFEPIAMWSSATFAFITKRNSRFADMAQVLDEAKLRPHEVSLGSTGTGAEYHYLIERLFAEAGGAVNYIGYRGGGDVCTAVAGGHVDVGYVSMASAAPLVQGGDLRFLAHTSEVRPDLAAFPDVPHVSAFGSKQTQVAFNTLVAPKGTPRDICDALAAALKEAMRDPDFVKAHEKLGMLIRYLGPTELAAYLENLERTVLVDYKAWKPS